MKQAAIHKIPARWKQATKQRIPARWKQAAIHKIPANLDHKLTSILTQAVLNNDFDKVMSLLKHRASVNNSTGIAVEIRRFWLRLKNECGYGVTAAGTPSGLEVLSEAAT